MIRSTGLDISADAIRAVVLQKVFNRLRLAKFGEEKFVSPKPSAEEIIAAMRRLFERLRIKNRDVVIHLGGVGVRYLVLEAPLLPAAELLEWMRLCRIYGVSWPFLTTAMLCSLLIVIAFIDLRWFCIPNSLVLIGLFLALIRHFILDDKPVLASFVGLSAGAMMLWLPGQISKAFFHRPGMGAGDVKLAAMLGLFVGWQQIVMIIWLACLAGAVYGIAGMGTGRFTRTSKIPLGFFLSLSAVACFLEGSGWISCRKECMWNFFMTPMTVPSGFSSRPNDLPTADSHPGMSRNFSLQKQIEGNQHVRVKVGIFRNVPHHAGDFEIVLVLITDDLVERILSAEIFAGDGFREDGGKRLNQRGLRVALQQGKVKIWS